MTHRFRHRPTARPTACRGGFTLVEILIAVSIIVLMIGLTLPAFRAITGSRSTEGATNQVTSMLAQVRSDAIGTQQPHGVAFYADAVGQCRMVEVATVPFTPWNGRAVSYPVSAYVTYAGKYYVSTAAVPLAAGNSDPSGDTARWHQFTGTAAQNYSDYYFASTGLFYDRLRDADTQQLNTDTVQLPLGVGVQLITDNSGGLSTSGTAVTRSTDGYVRDGVVMFDALGRLTSLPFVLSKYGSLGLAIGLHDPANPATTYNLAINSTAVPPLPAKATAPQPLTSSFGLVVYDRDAYGTQRFPTQDPVFLPSATYTGTTPSEADAENWLDANATPLLINRFTGALVRGE